MGPPDILPPMLPPLMLPPPMLPLLPDKLDKAPAKLPRLQPEPIMSNCLATAMVLANSKTSMPPAELEDVPEVDPDMLLLLFWFDWGKFFATSVNGLPPEPKPMPTP